jgi:hypothetical protein
VTGLTFFLQELDYSDSCIAAEGWPIGLASHERVITGDTYVEAKKKTGVGAPVGPVGAANDGVRTGWE